MRQTIFCPQPQASSTAFQSCSSFSPVCCGAVKSYKVLKIHRARVKRDRRMRTVWYSMRGIRCRDTSTLYFSTPQIPTCARCPWSVFRGSTSNVYQQRPSQDTKLDNSLALSAGGAYRYCTCLQIALAASTSCFGVSTVAVIEVTSAQKVVPALADRW